MIDRLLNVIMSHLIHVRRVDEVGGLRARSRAQSWSMLEESEARTADRRRGRTGGQNCDAFGVFGAALKEIIGVFHSSSLKMVPTTPKAS